MTRICDPLSQTSINIGIDCDGVWSVPFMVHCRDDTTFDPVMDDPQTDTISLTNLANREGSCRGQGTGDMMLVADPTYHTQREWLACGARQTLAVEEIDDLCIVVELCHITNFSNERIRIANCILALRPLAYFDCFVGAALPANSQTQQLWFRALSDGDIAN